MRYEFLFKDCKVILGVVNLFCEMKIKLVDNELQVAFFELLFKEIILQVASCVLWNGNYEMPVAFYESKVQDEKYTRWKFEIMFRSCEVVFYKLNIYDTNFTNYHQPCVESNFKGINLRKLFEKTIFIKCILTLDNSNTH